jgi:ubiquinone/menaquinone biosynthesis C-methylase UbiE
MSEPVVAGGDALRTVLEELGPLLNRPDDGQTANPEQLKSCCATVYGFDLITTFLGDWYHPGGPDLTRRLADALDLRPGQHVLDVASGIGSTACLLAQERAVNVTGVELGAVQVAKAQARARTLGLEGVIRFELGDAERLPIDDARFDAVVCECAFCTFPNKQTAAAEIARVLRPGGKAGVADVWLEPDRLEPELAGIAGHIACLADAKPIPVIHELLASAGLNVIRTERHDEALAVITERIRATLRALKIIALPHVDRHTLERAIYLTGKGAEIVARGDAGYLLLVAQRA